MGVFHMRNTHICLLLPCLQIRQLLAYLDMLLFDTELLNKRWTCDYYKTLIIITFLELSQ